MAITVCVPTSLFSHRNRENHRLDDSPKAATAQFTDAAKGAQGDLIFDEATNFDLG